MVRIRLTRGGAKRRPFYRVIAIDERAKRDGRPLEFLGTYNPVVEPPAIRLATERIEAWQRQGAQLSDAVRGLLKRARKQAKHVPAEASAPTKPPAGSQPAAPAVPGAREEVGSAPAAPAGEETSS